MSKVSIFMVAAAAGIAIAVPQAPAFAQGKGTSAGSAQKAKPSPSGSKYINKKPNRKPTRLRTAAEVINPAAAARYNTYKNSKTRRQPVSQPGMFSRFGQKVAAFFRRGGPRPGTTAAGANRMRPGVVSMVIGRMIRDGRGRAQENPNL